MSVLYSYRRKIPENTRLESKASTRVALKIAFVLLTLFIVGAATTLLLSLRCRFLGACPVAVKLISAAAPADLSCAAPAGRSADPDARKACKLKEAAQSFEAGEDEKTNIGKLQLLDSYRWREVSECAASSSICAAQNCYSDYLGEANASSLHKEEARTLLQGAESKCSASALSSLADGAYLARSSRGCGAKAESIPLQIRKGEISWRHELNGISYQWRGWINSSGAIEAYVDMGSGYAAVGQFSDSERNVTMQYPQCDGAISMQIINKLSN